MMSVQRRSRTVFFGIVKRGTSGIGFVIWGARVESVWFRARVSYPSSERKEMVRWRWRGDWEGSQGTLRS